jgi:hypothetical protein
MDIDVTTATHWGAAMTGWAGELQK